VSLWGQLANLLLMMMGGTLKHVPNAIKKCGKYNETTTLRLFTLNIFDIY